MQNELAPIVLFVYNRPWHTEQTLNALMQNDLADQSILYIFADGAKENATEDQLNKIKEVRQVIRAKQWCKEIYIIESEKNKGLADSVIDGVTKVVNQYGHVIVLEDDIVTSKAFLKYLNDALRFYEANDKVFHISAYMYPHDEELPETFFFNVPLCWGWATWKRAWSYFNPDAGALIKNLSASALPIFNKFGGNFLESQLKANKAGSINTWFIKWHGSVFFENGFTLYPGRSLVNNIGFDGSGVHNKPSAKFNHKSLPQFVNVSNIELIESVAAGEIIKKFYYPDLSVYTGVPGSLKQEFKRFFLKALPFKKVLKKMHQSAVIRTFPELNFLKNPEVNWNLMRSDTSNLVLGQHCKLYPPYHIYNSIIGSYTYVAQNSLISETDFGKFCSVGPNLMCGWGIHPIDGLSTSPMFYSTRKQNGSTFSEYDKIEERKHIEIGNDVFIGMNVTILDGVSIGNGAIIGAGSVVSKDIPDYAIAVGNPIKVVKYRFTPEQIEKLLKIKWWNFDNDALKEIEKDFNNVDYFINKFYQNN